MKEETTKDRVWSIALIALPASAVVVPQGAGLPLEVGLANPCCLVLGHGGNEQHWSMLMPRFLTQATQRSIRRESEVEILSVDLDKKSFFKPESRVHVGDPD